jgi:hypothetical protein
MPTPRSERKALTGADGNNGDGDGAPILTPDKLAAERLSAFGVKTIQRVENIFNRNGNPETVRLRDNKRQLWIASLRKTTKRPITTTEVTFVKIIPGRELPSDKYVVSTTDYKTATVTRTNFDDPANSGCEDFKRLIGETLPPVELALKQFPKKPAKLYRR